MIGEQAIFNLEIKKKSGLSINPDIHHSKVFSSGYIWNIIHVLSSKEGIHRTQDTKDTHWLEKLEKYIFVTCATARDLGAPSNSP